MRINESIRMALKNLNMNPVRSLLTMLGVIIGVGAVIAMLALGEGAKRQVTERIQAMGSNLLIINSGRVRRGGGFGSANVLNNDLLPVIFDCSSHIVDLAPESRGNLLVKANSGAGAVSIQTTIIGSTSSYLYIRNFKLAAGRNLTVDDLKLKKRVALVGAYVAQELFSVLSDPADGPLGKEIQIGNVRFTIIGLLGEKGQSGSGNNDDLVIIPLSTGQRRVLGRAGAHKQLNTIYVQVDQQENLDDVSERINNTLLTQLHDDKLFSIRNQAEMLATAQETYKTFTLLLAGIAGVSLLVGGIGIMNIMLVSVTERIKEIGVRKAVGAERSEILLMFLFEAITISVSGGLLGILLGWGGAQLGTRFLAWTTIVTPFSVLVSFLFSVAIGLFFGVYPAYKASSLSPVEALRFE